jgi:hypothetical protein
LATVVADVAIELADLERSSADLAVLLADLAVLLADLAVLLAFFAVLSARLASVSGPGAPIAGATSEAVKNAEATSSAPTVARLFVSLLNIGTSLLGCAPEEGAGGPILRPRGGPG